jgi:hypothetical protein
VVIFTIRAVNDHTSDSSRAEDRFQGLDVYEVLLKSFALVLADILGLFLRVLEIGVEMLFRRH